MNDSPHTQLILDTSLAAGSLLVPAWIYQISAFAGVITAIMGALLVIVRFLIAIREWRSIRTKELINANAATPPGNSQQ